MKNLFRIIHRIVSCHICHGMGQKENPNGTVSDCPACKGRGYL